MRVFDEPNPYERLKDLTRGREVTREDLISFVDGLKSVPEHYKDRMRQLTPSGYIGLSEQLVDTYFEMK
jgi:adenylosuccinate lyase